MTTYTAKELASIRGGAVTFTDGRAKWLALVQNGATDAACLALFKQQCGLGGGRGGPDIYYTRNCLYPLRLELYKEIGAPPYLTLTDKALVTALRLAWGISPATPEQPSLFDQLPFIQP